MARRLSRCAPAGCCCRRQGCKDTLRAEAARSSALGLQLRTAHHELESYRLRVASLEQELAVAREAGQLGETLEVGPLHLCGLCLTEVQLCHACGPCQELLRVETACQADAQRERSKALAEVEGLVKTLGGEGGADPRVAALRQQLQSFGV